MLAFPQPTRIGDVLDFLGDLATQFVERGLAEFGPGPTVVFEVALCSC
jgi:hypothetical protein